LVGGMTAASAPRVLFGIAIGGAAALTILLRAADAVPQPVAARCNTARLVLRTQSQGVNTSAWLGVLVRNRGPACHLTGSASVGVRHRGRLVRTRRRNPIGIPVRAVIRPGRLWLVAVAYWSNWCGPP